MLQPGVLKIAAHLGRTPCEGPRLDFETVGDPTVFFGHSANGADIIPFHPNASGFKLPAEVRAD
jgi:hypothetical protein